MKIKRRKPPYLGFKRKKIAKQVQKNFNKQLEIAVFGHEVKREDWHNSKTFTADELLKTISSIWGKKSANELERPFNIVRATGV